jgi:hypothetical protein
MYYTIAPYVKDSALRIFRVTDPDQRKSKLLKWLGAQKLSTQVLYSLLTMALASIHLSLDKYAIFYVCEGRRSDRTTIVDVLERHKQLEYLSKNESRIKLSREKRMDESEDCPPLVEREYRANERCTKQADLAVAYQDKQSVIPARWKWDGYIEGRAFKRDAYQFTPYLVLPTVSVANAISKLSSNSRIFLEWASPLRKRTEIGLRGILKCYEFDSNYRLIPDEDFRSSVFAGLALFDAERSKIHSFAIGEPGSVESKKHASSVSE